MIYISWFIIFQFQLDFLVSINGVCGHKKGSEIVRSVVHAMISPTLLKEYTWTGRSSTQVKKRALCTKENIIGLIYNVVKSYDVNYSQADCDYDLTYRVCKRANAQKKWVIGLHMTQPPPHAHMNQSPPPPLPNYSNTQATYVPTSDHFAQTAYQSTAAFHGPSANVPFTQPYSSQPQYHELQPRTNYH